MASRKLTTERRHCWQENKQLRRENLRASTSRGASAEIAVELEAKDKKIADLQSEMLEMLKNQNQEKKEEVELHRRVRVDNAVAVGIPWLNHSDLLP